MNGKLQLVGLRRKDIDEAAALAAAAFLHSPAYLYIFEHLGDARRLEALTWFFRKNFMLRLSAVRCAFSEDVNNPPRMVCCFMLQNPGTPTISSWALIKSGLLTMPWRFGMEAFRRLLKVKHYHEEIEHEFLKARENDGDFTRWCSLERMVVHPAVQGTGVGSRCLADALADVALSEFGVQLCTQDLRNVTFYKRLGFKEISQDSQYFRRRDSSQNINYFMVKEGAGGEGGEAAAGGTRERLHEETDPGKW
eukprot:CAMPEP_0179432212 /NCGR_PEP_ID=MMETSP0799-20121207/16887_1 /TAXON_ID=46947 /ORGANISM="Geminigera cryophila, Strain CCMP2564" /LENGTH=250 /DNA_ID=CAMNT_0021209487 /DNA_START=166 /DNA_END=915 /DNA_ORIENTATION=+